LVVSDGPWSLVNRLWWQAGLKEARVLHVVNVLHTRHGRTHGRWLFQVIDLIQLSLILVVNEVTPWSIGAETNGVISATEFGFVLGVAGQIAKFMHAMSKLTLVAVFAMSILLERPAQLSFITTRIDIVIPLIIPISDVCSVVYAQAAVDLFRKS
jgi:hypothetical protein